MGSSAAYFNAEGMRLSEELVHDGTELERAAVVVVAALHDDVDASVCDHDDVDVRVGSRKAWLERVSR
jgi:hypothetical protein